ncbi:MAG: sporulation transcriptional regulator SpoIIID [Oscillospiraceae bacterium]
MYEEHLRYTQLSRCEQLGRYIAESGDTVRGAAKIFGVSKSTVHKDLTKVLKEENLSLYKEVSKVLLKNKQERHLRGGLATKDKYDHLKLLKNASR